MINLDGLMSRGCHNAPFRLVHFDPNVSYVSRKSYEIYNLKNFFLSIQEWK